MNDRVYYLPVLLISHNGRTGSLSRFAVRPLPKAGGEEIWPLVLSPDGKHLLYVPPSLLYTAPDAQAETLEELIAQRHNARLAAETAKDGTIQPGAKRD